MGPAFYWPWNDEQSDELEEDTGGEDEDYTRIAA